MKIAIDSDDFGRDLKNALVKDLKNGGVEITDLDFLGKQKVDYPDIAIHLAEQVRLQQFDRGILICGTGLGMAMCANKVPGIFAGTCHDIYSAERLVKSNNAQIITMGAMVVGPELAKMIVRAFLGSEFQGGRSLPKVQRMRELDGCYSAGSAGRSAIAQCAV